MLGSGGVLENAVPEITGRAECEVGTVSWDRQSWPETRPHSGCNLLTSKCLLSLLWILAS